MRPCAPSWSQAGWPWVEQPLSAFRPSSLSPSLGSDYSAAGLPKSCASARALPGPRDRFPRFLSPDGVLSAFWFRTEVFFHVRTFPNPHPVVVESYFQLHLFTEPTLENEILHNFNCRLKKPVLETFTVSKITTGALRKLGQSVHFISVLHFAVIWPWAYLLVCIHDKVIRVDQCYLFWRLVSIDLVLGYLLWGKSRVCVCVCVCVLKG